MKRVLLVLLIVLSGVLYFQDSPAQIMKSTPAEKISPLKRKIAGLEFFLQDRNDHETFCPLTAWKQPSLKVYKLTLRSYLPAGCKES